MKNINILKRISANALSKSTLNETNIFQFADDTVELIDISIQTQCRLLKPRFHSENPGKKHILEIVILHGFEMRHFFDLDENYGEQVPYRVLHSCVL